MKQILTLLITFCSLAAFGQYPIRSIPRDSQVRGSGIPACKDFKFNIEKRPSPVPPEGCCFQVSITNNYNGLPVLGPKSFRIISNNATIISATTAPSGWNRTPATIPPNTNSITWIKTTGNIPTGQTSLGNICFSNIRTDPFYLKYQWLDIQGKMICEDSAQVGACVGDSCKNNLVRNGGFALVSTAGTMPSPGTCQNWARGYGSPIVNTVASEGCFEQGYIQLSGNKINGQAVVQALDPGNKIILGKKYRLSVAVRFLTTQNTLDYVKIRAIAFNGTIFSTNGVHPQPSTNVALIARSGKIHDCNDWSVIELPVWTANKDFSNIAINAFTNDGSKATVWIDDIILCETTQTDCDEVQVDGNGNPVLPAGYGNVTPGFTCRPEAEEEDYYNGSLKDLYTNYHGLTDSAFYLKHADPCWSIGGTIPQEVTNYNCDDSLRALGINMTCAEMQAMLDSPYTPPPALLRVLPPIPTPGNTQCGNPRIIENMPFGGRDIIYIHGLQMGHIIKRAIGYPPASGHWPNNANEYYNGYYKNVAIENMLPHINHFLRSRGNTNRYLIVTYDCSENAETAVHSVLSQIREAMENGTGVQAEPSDSRKTKCFARDFVMISHSTGALVADVALSIANKTKTVLSLRSRYGNIGLISDRCKGRISIQGAYSGSNLALIACTLQIYPLFVSNPVIGTIALTALTVGTILSSAHANTLVALPLIISNSILVDLVPAITRIRWRSYINDISVPVFTLAGGHPSAILGPLKYIIQPGFDDGVLTMDCANANNNPLILGPSCFIGNPIKAFDMGVPLVRGVEYFLDQKRIIPGIFATASTPYLSPTGMVEPVYSTILNPQNHFHNHFSFVQSSKEHWFYATEPDSSGNFPCDYKRTFPGGSTNNEESLVVTDPNLFKPSLIDASIIAEMGETIRHKIIYFPRIKFVYRHGIPRPTVYWREFYIWKRTYHKLNDNCMYDVDYAYKYLFRQ
jgi:hypothetical protein